MSLETLDVRLTSLEESRRDQSQQNKQIFDSLNRIEQALTASIAKACASPGHCLVIERETKRKWEGDSERFQRLEKRASENDAWRSEIEQKIDSLKTMMNRGMGAISVLIVAMPFLAHYVSVYLVNK